MSPQKGLYLSAGAGNIGDEHTVIRRTITVEDSLNKAIQTIRGKLTEQDREVDYTTMINLLATLGLFRLPDIDKWTLVETSVFNYFMGHEQLKLEAAIDQMQDLYVKQMPRIVQSALDAAKRTPMST